MPAPRPSLSAQAFSASAQWRLYTPINLRQQIANDAIHYQAIADATRYQATAIGQRPMNAKQQAMDTVAFPRALVWAFNGGLAFGGIGLLALIFGSATSDFPLGFLGLLTLWVSLLVVWAALRRGELLYWGK